MCDYVWLTIVKKSFFNITVDWENKNMTVRIIEETFDDFSVGQHSQCRVWAKLNNSCIWYKKRKKWKIKEFIKSSEQLPT